MSQPQSLCFNTQTQQVCLTVSPLDSRIITMVNGSSSNILLPPLGVTDLGYGPRLIYPNLQSCISAGQKLTNNNLVLPRDCQPTADVPPKYILDINFS